MKWDLSGQGDNKLLSMDGVNPKQRGADILIHIEGLTPKKETATKEATMDFTNEVEEEIIDSNNEISNRQCDDSPLDDSDSEVEDYEEEEEEEEDDEEDEGVANITKSTESMKMDEALSILRNELVRFLLYYEYYH